jgi:hypothetical protein
MPAQPIATSCGVAYRPDLSVRTREGARLGPLVLDTDGDGNEMMLTCFG